MNVNFDLSSILSGLNKALGNLKNTISTLYTPSSPTSTSTSTSTSTPTFGEFSRGPLANLAIEHALASLSPAAKAEMQETPSSSQISPPVWGEFSPIPPQLLQASRGGGTSWGGSSTSGPSTTGGLGGYSAPQPVSTPPAQTLPAGGFSSTRVGEGYGATPNISPNISGGGAPGYVSGGTGVSGYAAPVAGMAVPPPPVSINKPTTPPTPPIGQYEAMVRELQKLNPGGYIQTPLEQTPTYGPGYGMGRALKRLQEYQGMYR